MGLDAIAKRYFPAIICFLIAVAAYFQASGMGQLVAGSVADAGPGSAVSGPTPRPVSLGPNRDHVTSAEAILARNPFDSVTGPLDGTSVEIGPIEPPPVPENTDPYADPPCEVAKVILITQAEDPEWSFAAIAGSDGNAILRRQGDDIAGHKVYFIGWDRVWLTSGTARCQMEVGSTTTVKQAAAPAPAVAAPTKSSGKKVPAEIASQIHKVSENEFNVDRSVIDTILENQAELMRSARIVPEKQGDKVVGIRLFGIRPDSLLGTLGMQNGDRLQTINGFDMASPEKALEAYARLRTADHLTVQVNRRGKDQNIDFNIK